MEVIHERVVRPLKAAGDDDAWAGALGEVLPHWLRLRISLVGTVIELEGEQALDGLEGAASQVQDVPLTLLPEPAHGAARYSIAMLGAICEAVFAAARRRKQVDWKLVEALVEDIAVIELAWFTIAGEDRPRAAVAEAAAWEAYSRARPLRTWLVRAGLDAAVLPREDADEARARGAAMLTRVARGWSDAEEEAVERARLPIGALQ